MFPWVSNEFDAVQSWIFLNAVQPVLYRLGLITYDEVAFEAIAIFLYGVIQIALVYALVRPMEALMPEEKWPDRRGVRQDIIYTLITRLGLVPLLFFFLLDPLARAVDEAFRVHNILPFNLEGLSALLASQPLLSVCAYVVVLDFAEYWRHRLQHRVHIWWALHSLHHSQRTMSFWTDDRNHLLDEATGWIWFAAVAQLIGVQPGQFVVISVIGRMVESLSHANVRFGFGPVGSRLLVSPVFHRRHHAMGVGHDGRKYGCNFAVLFPVWDMMFGTADFSREHVKTGITDQLEGRDYGETFWRQQWLGLRRMWETVRPAH